MSTEITKFVDSAVASSAVASHPVLDNSDHVTRQEAQRQAAEAAGIVWPGTILPPGTALYSSGVEKLKSDRAAWRRLPLASEVIGLVANALHAEDRQDYPVDVAGLRLNQGNGRIIPVGGETIADPNVGFGYSDHAFRQLVGQIERFDDAPRGFASAMLFLGDRERAAIVNPRLEAQTLASTNKDAKEGAIVTVRTRNAHNGGRVTRAVLSGRYGSITDEDIAVAIGEVLAGDGEGRLDYKPGDSRSRFEIIYPSQIPIDTFRVGDIHYINLTIGNSDTGEGSLVVASGLLRAACANLTLSRGEGMEIRIRHIGERAALLQRLRTAIQVQLRELGPLVETITRSAKLTIAETWTPEKMVRAFAEKFGFSAKAMVEPVKAALTSGDQGRGYPNTVWGFASAVTEAAHANATWTDEADWEAAAGAFQRKAVEAAASGPIYDVFAKAVA